MTTPVIDFHTHAFPDNLADRAIAALQSSGGIPAKLDGRVSSLLSSMDRAGIERSVICSIATRPEQFEAILKWSGAVASERITPFPSVHPGDPAVRDRVRAVRRAGFRGVKIHPFYQDFRLDDEACLPLYETAAEQGLVVVAHTGFDFAFPFVRRADPARVAAVLRRFPGLSFVATHLGGWRDWQEVERHLLGLDVYFELSFSLQYLEPAAARRLILGHRRDRVLFGTDSPWAGQGETLELCRALDLDPATGALVLSGNARRLLA